MNDPVILKTRSPQPGSTWLDAMRISANAIPMAHGGFAWLPKRHLRLWLARQG